MPFDPRSLINRLPPFDPSRATVSSSFDGYRSFCQHYQLNFDGFTTSQQLGQLAINDLQIAVHLFRPAIQPAQGTLLIVHGYLDHHALYRHIICYGLQRNLNVLCFDLPGHGLSSGQRASIDSFDQYLQLLTTIADKTEQWQLARPLHLLGQSTGAAIINQYLLTADQEGQRPYIDGEVVLLAPLVRASNWRWVSLLHRLLSPWKEVVKRNFAPNSHDPTFNAFLATDPLQSLTISADWISALKRWIPQFEALPARSDIRPLIIQGQQDATVDWRYNLNMLEQKFPHRRLLEIKAARHQLANESQPIRDQYSNWLDRQGFGLRS